MVAYDDALKLYQDFSITDFMWFWKNMMVACLRFHLDFSLIYRDFRLLYG